MNRSKKSLFMTLGGLILLLPVLGQTALSNHVVSHHNYRSNDCETMTFQKVFDKNWNWLKTRLETEQGFAVPSTDNGDITGNGMTIHFERDRKAGSLSITIRGDSCGLAKEIGNFVESCIETEKITSPDLVWRIDEPNIKQVHTSYSKIKFEPNDVVRIKAGGCVQHGGSGLTWKRYVDAKGVGTQTSYYGTIKLPGMKGFVRILQFLKDYPVEYKIPSDASAEMFLQLGYQDFPNRYLDNGYWGPDNGIEDQCKGVEKAWVEIVIERP